MTTMTAEDIQLMIDSCIKAAFALKTEVGKSERSHRLDERHFRRVDKYSGGAGWKEFAFQIRTSAGAANSKVREAMDDIVKAGKEPDYDIVLGDWDDDAADTAGSELYAVLSSLVTGEAMMVVRSVPDGNGWEAWSRLFNRFDPRTPAKALMAMMQVMQPKKVKDVRELPSAVQDWENKVKNLKAEHDIDLDEKIKVALMTSFLPSDLQDYVFQWTDGKLGFGELRDRILSLAVNRASMSKPVPMEVDRVQADCWQDDHYGCEGHDWAKGWEEEGEEEVEIGYDGESCRRCGGMGHYARECPTQKGKGKGDWGKANGKGKSGWKGGETGWKGGRRDGRAAGKGAGKARARASWASAGRAVRKATARMSAGIRSRPWRLEAWRS